MTCRVARSFQHSTQLDLIYCCQCGTTHLAVFFTSKTLGPYLCTICAQTMVEYGEAERLTPETDHRLAPSKRARQKGLRPDSRITITAHPSPKE